MVNQKPRLCLAMIETAVDCWAQSIVDDLENGCQSDDEHVGQIFEVS